LNNKKCLDTVDAWYKHEGYTILFIIVNASGSSKQAWHIPDAVCTLFEFLMMGGETT
jgi:hypothetical protein